MPHQTRVQLDRSGNLTPPGVGLLLALLLVVAVAGASTGCLFYDIDRHAGAAWTATAVAAPPTNTPVPTAAPPARTPQATPTPRPTSTPRAAPAAIPTATPRSATSGLDTVFSRTAELRGLKPTAAVPLGYLTPEELQAYLVKMMEQGDARAQMETDKATLLLLDLVDERDDLYGLYLDAMTEQVAGFYDFEARQMMLVTRSQSPAPADELTLVHEYVHALQDQHFNIGQRVKEAKGDSERTLALHSLLEGDAALLMALYAQRYLTPSQIAQLGQQGGGPSEEKLKAAPPVLQWHIMFPYLRGSAFAATAYQAGGMPGINQLYSNPPVTSQQIMHPAKYFAGKVAKDVRTLNLLPALGSGWSVAVEDVMGEFGFWSYLRGGLPEADANRGADGWAGDRMVLLRHQSGRHALAIVSSWDSSAEAREFFLLVEQLRRARSSAPVTVVDASSFRWSGPSRSGYAAISGEEVLLVMGLDTDTVDRLVRGAASR
jgi:hypothetical protein